MLSLTKTSEVLPKSFPSKINLLTSTVPTLKLISVKLTSLVTLSQRLAKSTAAEASIKPYPYA